MPKTRINISLDRDLADFIKGFADENRTTVADVVTQYVLGLKRRIEGEPPVDILAHPAFREAMEEAREKLRAGTARWHSYDDVFGER